MDALGNNPINPLGGVAGEADEIPKAKGPNAKEIPMQKFQLGVPPWISLAFGVWDLEFFFLGGRAVEPGGASRCG
jgi:hypothetical protein